MGRHRILILGIPKFVPVVASLVQSAGWAAVIAPDGGHWRGRWRLLSEVLRGSAVYYVGGSLSANRFLTLCRFLRKPIIMHWVGTDVLVARRELAAGTADAWIMDRCAHFAEVSWISEELLATGVANTVVPLTSTTIVEQIPSLPQQVTVLTYLPPERPEFYGRELILAAARDFPDVKFLVTAAERDAQGVVLPNVEYLGFVRDMKSLYPRTTVLVRLTQHDGLSFMVLESLAAGRYVFWTREFDFVQRVTSYEDLRSHLGGLCQLSRNGQLQPNFGGAAFVRSAYSEESTARSIGLALSRAVGV